MPLVEGQMLGQYRIEAPMGQGGMATIYRATQSRLGRVVAIKMLHPAFVQDATFLTRFEREAQIVARLDHPHIVPVYDFSDYNGQPYLVMKFIDGSTLKQLVEDGPAAAEEIVRILTPIADALDYAHRQGVLHRDIKPSNILIGADGTPYLTDFGLARMAALGSSTLSGDMLLGTPHYISPEQAVGNQDLTPATDLYSLGVVLYELATGRVPFTADTPYAIVHAHIYDPLPAPRTVNPALSPAVEGVLSKALSKEPTERYATAAELIAAYRAAAAEAPAPPEAVKARPAPARPAVSRTERSTAAAVPLPAADPFDDLMNTMSLPPAPDVLNPSMAYPLDDEADYEKPKRAVVEASFDFSQVGESLRRAGESIKETFEEWGEANPETDVDFAAPHDEGALRRRVETQMKKRGDFWKNAIAYVVVIPILWIIFGTTSDVVASIGTGFPFNIFSEFPWPLIVMFGWGAGLAADAIETHHKTGKRAAHRLAVLHEEFRAEYGPQWYRTAPRKELRAIRRRVDKPIKQRVDFFKNLVSYLFIIPMLWVIFGVSSGIIGSQFGTDFPFNLATQFPWPLIVMFFWGLGIVTNGFAVLNERRKHSRVEREMERQREMVDRSPWDYEKPKNDFRDDEPRLTEDGELSDSMAREIERDLQRRRRS